jgi:O-antigen ligase
MFEDLDWVGSSWVNHAHNDYLELALVAGLPAVVMIIAYFVVAGTALARRLSFPLRGQRYAATAGIVILAGHSITDYPLRTFALLTLFAFFSALLYPSREARARRPGSGSSGRVRLSSEFRND